jgi:RecA-family ATPase
VGLWSDEEFDGEILDTVASAFAAHHDEEGAPIEDAFKPMNIDELYKHESNLKWVVGDLLSEGGVSIFAGPPKAGKSTIIRQMCKSVVDGKPFLGRPTHQGPVLYLALEEQISILKKHMKDQGFKKGDSFYVHAGHFEADNPVEELEMTIKKIKPVLTVIDTMALFTRVENTNDYVENTKKIARVRDLARRTNCHITFVHHSNKYSESQDPVARVMGSQAITGSVDSIILFEAYKDTRRITSRQRDGIPFDNASLSYNPDKMEYKIR